MYSKMKIGAAALAALAFLALAVPALAGIRPDDRSGIRGAGQGTAAVNVRPDDRPGLRGVGATSAATVARPDSPADFRPLRPDDRAGFRGILGKPQTIALRGQHSVAVTSRGFDWAAAGAGAGTATAMLLFLTWALTLRRNHRRAHMPA